MQCAILKAREERREGKLYVKLIEHLYVIFLIQKWQIKKGLMRRKFKNIVSLLFLIGFLLPSVVKFEHHHQHFECKAKNDKHFHEFHEKCSICNFEFAVFLSDIGNITLQKENPADRYCNDYISLNNYNLSQYSFLLRAPPCVQIWYTASLRCFF